MVGTYNTYEKDTNNAIYIILMAWFLFSHYIITIIIIVKVCEKDVSACTYFMCIIRDTESSGEGFRLVIYYIIRAVKELIIYRAV